MRLVQLNIWEGRLIRHIPDFIKRLNPDLVCLQEVFSSDSEVIKPSRLFSSLQQIQAACDYPHVFFSPTFSSVYEGIPVGYGNAILSRLPLLDEQATFTSGSYNPNQTAANIVPDTCNLQTVRVRSPKGDFSLANHHAYLGPDGFGDKTNVQKMRFVSEQLRDLPTPLIFAGDLNVVPESQTMRAFDGFLEDLTATNHISTTLTELGKVNDVACDHILVSPDVQAAAFYVDDQLVSDHKALVLDFDI
jgi:endonuclease/exonuclease/phosphatase family metal-dependent hydrolase